MTRKQAELIVEQCKHLSDISLKINARRRKLNSLQSSIKKYQFDCHTKKYPAHWRAELKDHALTLHELKQMYSQLQRGLEYIRGVKMPVGATFHVAKY